jgi:hypothetical protein
MLKSILIEPQPFWFSLYTASIVALRALLARRLASVSKRSFKLQSTQAEVCRRRPSYGFRCCVVRPITEDVRRIGCECSVAARSDTLHNRIDWIDR